jgi:hypothetical protein
MLFLLSFTTAFALHLTLVLEGYAALQQARNQGEEQAPGGG